MTALAHELLRAILGVLSASLVAPLRTDTAMVRTVAVAGQAAAIVDLGAMLDGAGGHDASAGKVTVAAVGGDVYIGFFHDGTTSTAASAAGTTPGLVLLPIFSGTTRDIDVEPNHRVLAYASLAGTPTLVVVNSSPRSI